MKIHEYQGKQILKSYDIPIQDGAIVENKEDIENAKNIAQFFLVGSIGIEMDDWELVKAETEKQKHRWDHEFEWKEKSFNINESTHRITVKVQGSVVDYYNEWIKVPDTWKRKYQKVRSKNELLSQIGGSGYTLTIFLIFIMIFVRSRKKDIRWKTAFIYAGIAGVLLLLQFYQFQVYYVLF